MKIFSFIGCCPQCQSNSARVVLTKKTLDNQIVRRRSCPECGHRWYTLQYPEIEVSSDEIYWDNVEKSCRFVPKRLANA